MCYNPLCLPAHSTSIHPPLAVSSYTRLFTALLVIVFSNLYVGLFMARLHSHTCLLYALVPGRHCSYHTASCFPALHVHLLTILVSPASISTLTHFFTYKNLCVSLLLMDAFLNHACLSAPMNTSKTLNTPPLP